MKNQTRSILITLAAVALSGFAMQARAQDEKPSAALLARAKISKEEAQKIALGAVLNAKVKSSELEDEDGSLRWSFDLTTPDSKKIIEVGVDAITGKIVENKVEDEKDEAKEKADDKDKDEHKDKP